MSGNYCKFIFFLFFCYYRRKDATARQNVCGSNYLIIFFLKYYIILNTNSICIKLQIYIIKKRFIVS